MNVAINKLILDRFHINIKLFSGIIVTAIVTGTIIVSGEWLYSGILLLPMLIYFCIKNPFIFPLGLYVFLLPFDEILAITGNVKGATLTKLLGILTILVLALKGSFEKKFKKPDAAVFWLLLFVMYCGISIVWAVEPALSVKRIITIAGLAVLYLLVSLYSINEKELNTIKWFILAGGLLAALYLIYTYYTGWLSETGRRALMEFGDRSSNINKFAFALLIPFSITIEALLKQNKMKKKILFIAALALLLLCFVITGSRGAMLGAGTILIIYFINLRKKLPLLFMFLLMAVVIMPFFPESFFERWDGAIESGGSGRLDVWYVSWKALEKYGIWGGGIGNFSIVFNEFENYAHLLKRSDYASHSLYIGMIIQVGIVGLTLMLLAIWKHYKAIRSSYNHKDINSFMLKASTCGVIVHSIFIDSLWHKSFWMLFMLIMMHKNVSVEKIICNKKN